MTSGTKNTRVKRYKYRFPSLIETEPIRKNPLTELIGIETSKTGRVGLNIDKSYLND